MSAALFISLLVFLLCQIYLLREWHMKSSAPARIKLLEDCVLQWKDKYSRATFELHEAKKKSEDWKSAREGCEITNTSLRQENWKLKNQLTEFQNKNSTLNDQLLEVCKQATEQYDQLKQCRVNFRTADEYCQKLEKRVAELMEQKGGAE